MGSMYYTPVRRNHLIGPAGVGSLLVTRSGVTVLMCGLPSWVDAVPAFGSEESARRADRVQRMRSQELHDHNLEEALGIDRLISPPVIEDNAKYATTWFVPAVRFPRGEYCTNPACRSLGIASPESQSIGRCDRCTGKYPPRRQQTPVVLVCAFGHLAEVDWAGLVHPAGSCTGSPRLSYHIGNNSSAPEIRCECGAKARLDPSELRPCTGSRPWLPASGAEQCAGTMRVLDRTSTQVYYPDVRSAVHIPPDGGLRDAVIRWLEDDVVAVELRKIDADDARGLLLRRALPLFPDLTMQALEEHVQHLNQAAPHGDRFAVELEALTSGRRGTHTSDGPPILDAEVIQSELFAPGYVGDDSPIERVVAVHRLAETRVLAGFTRLDPPSRALEGAPGYSLLWGHQPNTDPSRDWLPGMRVYGEGILLELNPRQVSDWAKHATRQLMPITLQGEVLTAEFMLAHTMAHLLMNAASLQCGYPVASLRDRIYTVNGRTALLIYTGEGDMIGTMGGLVELAQPGRLEEILDQAYANAHWCALDPVCLSPVAHIKNDSPGACHQCCFLPETSCDWWNEGLDRATLIGRDELRGYLEEGRSARVFDRSSF